MNWMGNLMKMSLEIISGHLASSLNGFSFINIFIRKLISWGTCQKNNSTGNGEGSFKLQVRVDSAHLMEKKSNFRDWVCTAQANNDILMNLNYLINN